MSERFPRIAPETMSDKQREVAAEISAGPRGEVKGPFIALLHNPELAGCLQKVGEHLRFGTGMPGEVIELAILITARAWDCQYEWVAHRRIAANTTSLGAEIMDAVARNERPVSMTDELQDVYDFCIEAQRLGAPSAEAYERVEQRYGKRGVLDLLAICGYYALLAMVLNTAEPPLPDGMEAPLKPLRAGAPG